jgi:hypothetical protein
MHRNPAGQLVFDVPDQLAPRQIAAAIAARFAASTPASPPPSPSPSLERLAPPEARVVWVDRGDEVLVHLDAVHAQIVKDVLLVAVDLECDQTGRPPLVVALALAGAGDAAGLIAATDDLPHGNGALAARWGALLTDAVWSALLDLARRHAEERGTQARGFQLSGEALHLLAGPAAATHG